jgi:hypothetical protein
VLSLIYSLPPGEFPLRQGEVLSNLLALHPKIIENKDWLHDDTKVPPLFRNSHPWVLIVSPACDLYWDWVYRKKPADVKKDDLDQSKLLDSIQFCDLFEKDEIRQQRGLNSNLWERIRSNQDERYHRFTSSKIGDEMNGDMPELYVDFKRVFSLPTEFVYELISNSYTVRSALLSYPHLMDIIHRLFSYAGRVAIPDDDADV